MYIIRARNSFTAVHALPLTGGGREEPHQHTFALEVEITANCLDDAGCVFDFRELDCHVDAVIRPLEGVDLAEHALFQKTIPSAEGIAEIIFLRLSDVFRKRNVNVAQVVVWEDERHAGCVREDA